MRQGLGSILPVGSLALVTISGGAGIVMADAAAEMGLDVSPMPEDAQADLKQLVPFAAPRNPVDVTAHFFNDLSLIPNFTKLMLERGDYDGMIGFWMSVAWIPYSSPPPCLAGLKQAMAGQKDKLFMQTVVAPEEIIQEYEEAGFPCFEDPSRAVVAMAGLMYFGEAFATSRSSIVELPDVQEIPEGLIGELQAKEILHAAGLPMLIDQLATSAAEAEQLAIEIGGPVALKIAAPDLLHKTDIGGVLLDVRPADAAVGFEKLLSGTKALVGKKIDGVLISPMVEDGIDCLLGGKIDPVFGPMVLFGLGGIYTEILNDKAMRRAPVDQETASAMIDEVKAAALLKGTRGRSSVDLDQLASVIAKFSNVIAAIADQIETVEINPLRALPDRLIGLDAVIIKRTN